MASLLGWIKNKAANLVEDPESKARVEEAARQISVWIVERRDRFEIGPALAEAIAYPQEFPKIVRRTYELFLRRGWRDGELSDEERSSLKWIAGKLGLEQDDQARMDYEAGVSAFKECFGKTLDDDGQQHEAGLGRLKRIARAVETTPADIVRREFLDEASHLLKNLLSRAMPRGGGDRAGWKRLFRTIEALGIDMPTFRAMVAAPARQIIECALAEASADGEISEAEVRQLQWLVKTLVQEDTTFSHYVLSRIEKALTLQRIRAGQLPSVNASHAGLRAGEIVHFIHPATYQRVRNLRSGPVQELFTGTMLVTDARMIFTGEAFTLQVPHGRVAAITASGTWTVLQCSGKGGGSYNIGLDPAMNCLIYDIAVCRANQTVVQAVEGSPTRHIPRDVRQRVWQQYGGRCADCQATDYLEFDHIVPVAKGGSNSEQNVQLLCRQCNGKKSDRI